MGITRQLAALDDLLRRAAKVPEIEAVVLIGSLASGAADSVSDVDAIVIVREACPPHRLSSGVLGSPDRPTLGGDGT